MCMFFCVSICMCVWLLGPPLLHAPLVSPSLCSWGTFRCVIGSGVRQSVKQLQCLSFHLFITHNMKKICSLKTDCTFPEQTFHNLAFVFKQVYNNFKYNLEVVDFHIFLSLILEPPAPIVRHVPDNWSRRLQMKQLAIAVRLVSAAASRGQHHSAAGGEEVSGVCFAVGHWTVYDPLLHSSTRHSMSLLGSTTIPVWRYVGNGSNSMCMILVCGTWAQVGAVCGTAGSMELCVSIYTYIHEEGDAVPFLLLYAPSLSTSVHALIWGQVQVWIPHWPFMYVWRRA